MVELGMFEDERIELLRGVLVQMSPIGTRHSATVDRLTRVLILALSERATVRVQNPFAATDDSEPEPDFCVVPLGDYDDAHPAVAHLLIEVAESSLRIDRGVKLGIYAENGVPEYWVVDVAHRCMEVYTQPSGNAYRALRTVGLGETLRPVRFADIELRIDDVLR